MMDSFDNDEWTRHLNQQPLNAEKREIRLLKLLPSKVAKGSIAFELVRHELHTELESGDYARPYYALSYVWGLSEKTQAIVVDGQPVQIRENLWQFLQSLRNQILRLRRAARRARIVTAVRRKLSVACAQDNTIDIGQVAEVLLWADFLCINQRDLAERSSQVAIMASIFQQASAVIGWLGSPDSYRAASVLTRLLSSLHYPNKFATDPYWSRLWIVQEIVLARRLWMLCQDLFLRFNDYDDLFHYLEDPTLAVSKFCKISRWFFEGSTYTGPAYSFVWFENPVQRYMQLNSLMKSRNILLSNDDWDLIHLTSRICNRVSCTDARNKVYGMLAMLPTSFSVLIDVGYGKPVLQVYFEACIALLGYKKSVGDFFLLLGRLCTTYVPLEGPPYRSEGVAIPSIFDLSFLPHVQDVWWNRGTSILER